MILSAPQSFGEKTLGDVGEAVVRDEVILKLMPPPDEVPETHGRVVPTTNPMPYPNALHQIGEGGNFRLMGRFAVWIGLRGLPPKGARPINFLSSLKVLSSTRVADLWHFFVGVREACLDFGIEAPYGGNVRELQRGDLNTQIECVGYGVLMSGMTRPLGYVGAEPGHVVVVIGELGRFWSAIAGSQRAMQFPERRVPDALLRSITHPVMPNELLYELAAENLLSTCVDNSDGIYTMLRHLSARNKHVGFDLDVRRVHYSPEVRKAAEVLGIRDPFALARTFGDPNVICTVPRENLSEVLARCGDEAQVVGVVREAPGISIVSREGSGEMLAFDQYRFPADGASKFDLNWTTGLDYVLHAPIAKPGTRLDPGSTMLFEP